MQKFWRGILVLGALLLITASVAAFDTNQITPRFFDSSVDFIPPFDQNQPTTSVDIIVLPREGEQGGSHQIAVSGLQSGESVTIRIIEDATGNRVYNSSRTASGNGRVQIDIFTTADDAIGTYTIEVVNSAGTVIGTTSFTILEVSGLSGTVSIAPESATAGSTHTIEISNVRAFLDLEVVVLNEANERVFVTQVRTTVDGEASVQYTSTPRDGGEYRVIIRAGDNEVASGTLLVDGPVAATELVLVPDAVEAGEEVIVSVTGLDADETVTIIVTQAGSTVTTIGETADVNGNVIFFLPTTDAPAGIYDVRILSAQGVTLAQASYQVLGEASAITFVVTPESGTTDAAFVFSVSGLNAGEVVTVQLIENNAVVISHDIRAAANGSAALILNRANGLIAGEFTAQVVREGVAVAQVNIVVEGVEAPATEAPAQPTDAPQTGQADISIEPTSGTIPTSYNISASGLEAGSSITIQVRYQGNVIYAVDGLVGNNGTFTTGIISEVGDPVGEYTLELVQNGTVLDSVTFNISGDTAEVEPTQQSQQVGDVTIDVPATVNLGGGFEIRVNGLNPSSEVAVSIEYQNTSVFTTNRTADGAGSVILPLQTDGTEETGTYAVVVRQDGVVIASQNFEIIGDATPTPVPQTSNASVVVNPPAGVLGTDHAITVSGLTPNETVTLDVLFGGNVVFSSERTADASGSFTINLTSEETDPSGDYEIRVSRSGQVLASATMTVTESSAAQPQATQPPAASDATVTIDPASGAIGTTHNITVSGLTPNANVTLDIRYNGASVYSTSRTADATGSVALAINSESGDPEGTYSVVVIENGAEIAAGDFVVGSGLAQPQATQPPAASDGATVTIDPASGAIGTTHNITVSGLTPNANVTLDIRYNGASVYSTSRTADATGSVALAINSESGDPEGTYSVVVIENGAEIAAGDFVVGSGSAQPQATQPPAATEVPATPSASGVTVNVDPQSGAIGTAHTITVTGLEPNESIVLQVSFAGASVFATERTADVSGTVALTLTTEEGDSEGQYTVTILRGDNAIGSAQFTIGTDTTVAPTATPDAGSPNNALNVNINDELTIADPAYRYPISGNAGDSIVIRLQSDDFDAYLLLEDENGNLLAENDDATGTFNSQIGPFTLPYSGTFVVVASSYPYLNLGEATAGAFNLTIETLTVDIPTTDIGAGSQLITGNLSAEVPSANFTFTGEAGETVLIALDSLDFDTFLTLQDADGNELTFNDDAGGTVNSQIGPYALPYSGTYSIVVSSYSFINYGEAVSGAFTVRIERVSIMTTSYGTTSTVNLSAENSAQILSFDAQAGDVITVTVDGEIDTVLTLTDPDGIITFTDDDGGLGFNPEVPRYVIPNTGTFSIMVSSFAPSVSGSVNVTLSRTDVRTLDTETRIVSLNAKQSSDILTLAGTVGSRVNLNISLLSGEVGNLNITVRQGENVLMYYQTFGMPEDIALGFAIPAEGAVNIIVEDLNTAGSTLEFSITTNQ